MTKRSMPCLFHATLYALGAARLRMLNLLRSVDPLGTEERIILRRDFGSMPQNPDSPTTLYMSNRSTCGFIIANPRVLGTFLICCILPKHASSHKRWEGRRTAMKVHLSAAMLPLLIRFGSARCGHHRTARRDCCLLRGMDVAGRVFRARVPRE